MLPEDVDELRWLIVDVRVEVEAAGRTPLLLLDEAELRVDCVPELRVEVVAELRVV